LDGRPGQTDSQRPGTKAGKHSRDGRGCQTGVESFAQSPQGFPQSSGLARSLPLTVDRHLVPGSRAFVTQADVAKVLDEAAHDRDTPKYAKHGSGSSDFRSTYASRFFQNPCRWFRFLGRSRTTAGSSAAEMGPSHRTRGGSGNTVRPLGGPLPLFGTASSFLGEIRPFLGRFGPF